MFKRFGLFFLVNVGVMITISVITSILGLNRYMSSQGINYPMLMGFCLVWGLVGSFISLMMSKMIAKWTMGLQIIDGQSNNQEAIWLMNTVRRLSQSANLPKEPEVAIYESPEVNAFATGPSRGNSLVAVSTGLLSRMDQSEVEGVLAHEVSHIANGDMVTMTLIQGVINAFVMFFAKIVAWAVANAMRSNDDEGPSFLVSFLVEMVLYVLFGMIGSIIVNWFSRQREFRADAGASKLVGSNKMVAALRKLEGVVAGDEEHIEHHKSMASLKISGSKKSFSELFSTHPSLRDRIDRLQSSRA